MESKQNQCLTLSRSSLMYLALTSQADQREKNPARSSSAQNPALPGGEGRPVYHQTPCARVRPSPNRLFRSFCWIRGFTSGSTGALPGCCAKRASFVGRLVSSSQQIPPAPGAPQWVFQRSEIRQVKCLMDKWTRELSQKSESS